MSCTVLLTHGFIGFGKTTVAKRFEPLGYKRFTHDEYMVKMFGDHPSNEEFISNYNKATEVILQEAKDSIKNNENIILDFGFWTKESRKWIYNLIKDWESELNIKINVLWLNIKCDINVARQRCLIRDQNRTNNELWVPITVFDGKLHKFEPMDDTEWLDSQLIVKQ